MFRCPAGLRVCHLIIPRARTLVFLQFRESVDVVAGHCARRNIPCFTIHGSMTRAQRSRNLTGFGEHEGAVFLLTMRSGAVGLNLTAASRVVMFEPCLTETLHRQAIGRTVRIGQRRCVEVVSLVCAGTVDEELVRCRRDGHRFNSETVRRVLGVV